MYLKTKMANLVQKVGTFIVGTTPEIKEKVGKRLSRGLYYAEFVPVGLFVADAIRGELNPYVTAFAVDGITRIANTAVRMVKHNENSDSFEAPGIIGTVRELYQKYRK